MVGETIRVEIRRSDPGARRTFALPRRASLVVLDLILAAAREDPSLCYRYSCRSGYCGTCTVALDGHPVLACRTPVPPGARAVEIGPLPGFPIVRDLVVDVRPFTDRWAAAGGRLEPRAPAATPTRSRRFVDEALDCISCGACVAACDLSGADRPFLGPAALTRAMVVIADERTTDRR
ncbi:MAG TPA: 2Fe-2S iron-sulfur cluster-binding protein, partial [Candidatus Limnocylindrales bacterium]|nr:2Fe-2S iron-sulfur cluster-binding protein [Candidatus Limnocylindrales bacterium]